MWLFAREKLVRLSTERNWNRLISGFTRFVSAWKLSSFDKKPSLYIYFFLLPWTRFLNFGQSILLQSSCRRWKCQEYVRQLASSAKKSTGGEICIWPLMSVWAWIIYGRKFATGEHWNILVQIRRAHTCYTYWIKRCKLWGLLWYYWLTDIWQIDVIWRPPATSWASIRSSPAQSIKEYNIQRKKTWPFSGNVDSTLKRSWSEVNHHQPSINIWILVQYFNILAVERGYCCLEQSDGETIEAGSMCCSA